MTVSSFLLRKFGPSRFDRKAKPFFNRAFYLSKYQDVARSEIDPFHHYCAFGWKERRDPSPDFSTRKYLEEHPELIDAGINPLAHYAENHRQKVADSTDKNEQKSVSGANLAGLDTEANSTVTVSLPNSALKLDELQISFSLPSKDELELVQDNMDEKFYLDQIPNLAVTGAPVAQHYLTLGWLMGLDPSPEFSTSYYLRHNQDIRNGSMHPFVHFLKYGIKEQWRKRASVRNAKVLSRFEKGPLAEMVKEAVALDPMVALPMGRRMVTSPFTHNHPKLLVAKKLREALVDKKFEHVVLIPHIRMSGATRIAGHFTTALSEIYGAENILVLMTDASHNEHPEWFPEKVELFPFYEYLESISENDTDKRAELLYDVLRGICCQNIYNVNSRLCWETLRIFGRQMSQEFNLTNYFFCWEEAKSGERLGYPIQWLRDTVNYQHYMITDSQFLADDIMRRFGISDEDKTKVIALRTPLAKNMSEIGETDFAANKFSFKVKSGRPNAIWAGRFDRQKRIDVLVDIAKANPHIDFWVFGKTVLDNMGLDHFKPPKNLIAHEPFDHFDQLLPLKADFFLYTAQWDGVPTILLDAAQNDLPIVAPDIGGISEVINEKTGWLVSDHEDIEGYSSAIKSLLTNETEAAKRAAALKEKISDERQPENYIDAVKRIYQ